MKGIVDKVSAGVMLASNIGILLVVFLVRDGGHSFWLIPLCLCSMGAVFSGSAFGNRQSFIPKRASQVLFWFASAAAVTAVFLGLSDI
jgi:hypothetical protein